MIVEQIIFQQFYFFVLIHFIFRWFAEELCNYGLSTREHTPVAAKFFGLIAHHQAGDCKILILLMRRVQDEYNSKFF